MERRVIRQAAVAGSFYPASREGLLALIEECFTGHLGPRSVPSVSYDPAQKTLGLVSPHAGYVYSGPCAAHGFARAAQAGLFETVVVVGPNHRGWGAAVAIHPPGEFVTPLGTMVIDEGSTASLSSSCSLCVLDEAAHRAEHSVEVQIPFLQRVWGEKTPKLVAILIAEQRVDVALELGRAIARTFQDRPVLLIASTDFTHYRPRALAEKQDKFALDKIVSLDPVGLMQEVTRHSISMCGCGPVAAMLEACKRLGCGQAELLNYVNSGEVTGDFSDVVSYASVAVT